MILHEVSVYPVIVGLLPDLRIVRQAMVPLSAPTSSSSLQNSGSIVFDQSSMVYSSMRSTSH